MRKNVLIILISLFVAVPIVYAESITLTTYYPAPFGAYDRLRLVPGQTFLISRGVLQGPCI